MYDCVASGYQLVRNGAGITAKQGRENAHDCVVGLDLVSSVLNGARSTNLHSVVVKTL